MVIKTNIEDPATGKKASVVNGDEENALVVATRPLKELTTRSRIFTTNDGKVEMNVDGNATGTPEQIHNGNDTTLWTGTAIVGAGRWIFTNTAQNHTPSGTASVSLTLGTVGDVAQFSKGSNLDLSLYNSLTIWVYISSGWSELDVIEVYGWDTTTGSQVGNSINLTNYISVIEIGSWQKAIISLSDLNLVGATIDALRLEYSVRDGVKVSFYVDDIQFEESGGGIQYFIKPLNQTWLNIKTVRILFIDEYDSTVLNGTVPGISHSGILGVNTLPAGILFQQVVNDKVIFNAVIKDLSDVLQFPSFKSIESGYDGTDTWITITIEPDGGLLMKSEQLDYLRIVINDDLTGLKKFRITANGTEEDRTKVRRN